MTRVGILTDNTAQFPIPAFPGRDFVHVISLDVEINGERFAKGEGIKAQDFPRVAEDELSPKIIPPSPEDFERFYNSLSQRYEEIVVITHSSHLTNTHKNATIASKNFQGATHIEVIDGQTTATGLGLVVQSACAAVIEGKNAEEIEAMTRSLLPRIYTVFCIPSLSYLHYSGYLGLSQAIIGEHIKMMPLFILDQGQLVPTQKARNKRHLVDLLHEFIFEFKNLTHIGFIQGIPPFENETRALRERIVLDYESIPISEHTINPFLSALFGPHTLGMFILQGE